MYAFSMKTMNIFDRISVDDRRKRSNEKTHKTKTHQRKHIGVHGASRFKIIPLASVQNRRLGFPEVTFFSDPTIELLCLLFPDIS